MPEAPLPSDWPPILLGLIGAGVQASRTPRMHEREGARHGLRTIYRLIDLTALGLDASALPDLVTAAERMGFTGLNITHPCKQAVIPLLDELSPEAAALGAVNTVLFREGRRIGHNTDGWGFAEGFRRELGDASREAVVQLGAGGAGAAVAHALLDLGVERLTIVDPEPARAATLVEALERRFGRDRASIGEAAQALPGARGIVNATPVGMADHPGTPLPPDLLTPEQWVADIIYLPIETALLREARARGCRTMGGSGMAVFQAVRAFELFTGIEPDAERMRRHFESL
ncbi:shikimate dehydrogenase [Salinarimonas soli]|uniref:Shikimate dehydrogenase (NADP(+)) n=1 Tax=Salinarimonas soli TaxID=1638099 RepID=A0A5B2VEL0_9HYPH|nr:shikimate dehydrogenase [Salinarimonas soli]KAA2237541.1 shikimate dehydrogenase [Salinarimonas soli]